MKLRSKCRKNAKFLLTPAQICAKISISRIIPAAARRHRFYTSLLHFGAGVGRFTTSLLHFGAELRCFWL